jgi:hypothetical protein
MHLNSREEMIVKEKSIYFKFIQESNKHSDPVISGQGLVTPCVVYTIYLIRPNFHNIT